VFSEQNFVFSQANQDSLLGLLNRGLGEDPASQGSATGQSVPVRTWARAEGTLLNAGDPFKASIAGLEAGADAALGPSGRVGASLGYESVNLSDSDGGSAGQDIYRIGVYGSQSAGGLVFSAAAAYAYASDRTDRASGLGPSTASRQSNAVTGGVEVSAPFIDGGVSLTPTAGVLISDITGGAFTEFNGHLSAFAIHGDSSSVTAVAPFAQLSMSHAFTLSGGAVVTPNVLIGYRYDGSANGGDITVVSEDGTVFVGNKLNLDPNTAVLGVGVSAHQNALTAFVKFRATVSANWHEETLTAGLRWSF
jgi:hypothetical protein